MIKYLLDYLLPPTCVLCSSASQQTIDLCSDCEHELPWVIRACLSCGLPLPKEQTAKICGGCLNKPALIHRFIALYYYQAPINYLIMQLKFHEQLKYGKLLGELLSLRLQQDDTPKPECIIPVPLHASRLRERGYNQALEIARPIARRLKLPIDKNSCQRIRHTPKQSSSRAKTREDNIRNAFSIRKDFSPQHVAIIDDVVTTGHTVLALSHALQKQGVKKIEVWCCARTLPQQTH